MVSNALTNNAMQIFNEYGCKDISTYSLVNNYGFKFTYNNVTYDLRYWRNCYGVELNYWDASAESNADNNLVKQNKSIIKEIVTKFNAKCR